MTFLPDHIKTEGNVIEATVSDDSTQQLLTQILKELKKMNLHLSTMTDTIIDNADLED